MDTARRRCHPLQEESNISAGNNDNDDRSTDFLFINSSPDSTVPLLSSSSWSHVWNAYRSFVQKNQIILHLADEAVTRFLFWMPQDLVGKSHPLIIASSEEQHRSLQLLSSRRRRFREVCFGLLALHRMIMDMALQDVIINSYGTTMCLDDEQPRIPATSIRLCLTVFHDLMPTLMELYRPDPMLVGAQQQQRPNTNVRLHLERTKFMLRLALMISYWRQLWIKNQTLSRNRSPWRQQLLAGLLQEGGMFYPDDHHNQSTPTLMQEHSYTRRLEYYGRRTGRRVIASQIQAKHPSGESDNNNNRDLLLTMDMARLAAGELWNIYRPLHWAQVEASISCVPVMQNRSRQVLWWLMSLAMDCLSLKCLERFTQTNNPASKMEWNRRRMKLFLYVLRSPFWDEATYPGAQRLANDVLRRIPLLGRILEAYLWDWIYYWKHPWASERD